MPFLFRSSHNFVSWFLVFWSLCLRDFLSIFFRLAHLALQNVNKDYVIFLYFRNFVTKSDQKSKTKNGTNETLERRFLRTELIITYKNFSGLLWINELGCICTFWLNLIPKFLIFYILVYMIPGKSALIWNLEIKSTKWNFITVFTPLCSHPANPFKLFIHKCKSNFLWDDYTVKAREDRGIFVTKNDLHKNCEN